MKYLVGCIIYPDASDSPSLVTGGQQQQKLRQASANQNSYNALTVVLTVIVAVMLVILAVLVTERVWSIIKKKEDIKDR